MENSNLQDAYSHESLDRYQLDVDANLLYEAFLATSRSSIWKPSVQKFEMNWLSEISAIHKDLSTLTYEYDDPNSFWLMERGKPRRVSGDSPRDRVVKHYLCDNIINPALHPYLIFDNGASIKGKGISFSRRRLEHHLHKYYKEHGNQGYIALIDFSKYYDNIEHDRLLRQWSNFIDSSTIYLIRKALEKSEVCCNKEEYERYLSEKFDSLEFDFEAGGEYKLRKHVNIGDQISQSAGVSYTNSLDIFIKVVCGEKYYGRYMDDSYIISDSKEHLIELLQVIEDKCRELGVFLNIDKTRIYKLSSKWVYLKVVYTLEDTGKIIHHLRSEAVRKTKRRTKRLYYILTEDEVRELFRCWICQHKRYLRRKTVFELNEWIDQLYADAA